MSTLAKYPDSLRAANTLNGWGQTGDAKFKEDGLAQGQEDLQHLPHIHTCLFHECMRDIRRKRCWQKSEVAGRIGQLAACS